MSRRQLSAGPPGLAAVRWPSCAPGVLGSPSPLPHALPWLHTHSPAPFCFSCTPFTQLSSTTLGSQSCPFWGTHPAEHCAWGMSGRRSFIPICCSLPSSLFFLFGISILPCTEGRAHLPCCALQLLTGAFPFSSLTWWLAGVGTG